MNSLVTALVIIGIIVGCLSIIVLIYTIASQRRKSITYKKIDYLVEDITYKSEMLNSTVETIAKISNYIDIFEVVARKNMKSAAKVLVRNKDDIYKIAERLKKVALGETETQKMKSPKKESRFGFTTKEQNDESAKTFESKGRK